MALLVITETVLRVAGGGVRTEDLARVLQTRFHLLRPPRFVALDDDPDGLPDEAAGVGVLDVESRASWLLGELTASERQLVPFVGEPQRWSSVLGTGPALARVAGEKLIEKLRLATADDADHEEVVLRLVALCQAPTADGLGRLFMMGAASAQLGGG